MPDVDTRSAASTRRRYDRLAGFYNLVTWPMETLRIRGWRRRLGARIRGEYVLELGVGTGANMPFYPPGTSITAVDISRRMLAQAAHRAMRRRCAVDLRLMDAQQLALADATFDTIFAAFVFCSVPDPVRGLREARRVCRPDGRLLLLEHMRPGRPLPGMLFDWLNPLTVRLTGAHINRRTLANIEAAGWHLLSVEDLAWDVVRLIEAAP